MPYDSLSSAGVELEFALSDLHEYPVHSHENWELMVVFEGRGTHILDGNKHVISTGDVFLVKDGHSHGFEDLYEIKLAVFTFRNDLLLPYEDDLLKMPGYSVLFRYASELSRRGKSRIRLSPRQQVEVEKLSLAFQSQSRRVSPCDILLKLKFVELVVYLSQEYFDTEFERQPRRLTKVGETIGFIRGHFRESMTLEELARRSGMSVNNFLRVFKEITGRTPMEYLLLERVKYGGRLLAETSMRIGEVAEASGFPDSNYFARQFRRFVDLSPREYRRLTALSFAKREKLAR